MTEPSKRRPKYTTSVGGGLSVFACVRWAFYLTREWGYVPYRGLGMPISFGLVLGMMAVALLVDYVLARIGVGLRTRSALWFAALLGPYAGLVALNEWGHPVGSQAISVVSTLVAFGLGYWLEKALGRKTTPDT